MSVNGKCLLLVGSSLANVKKFGGLGAIPACRVSVLSGENSPCN